MTGEMGLRERKKQRTRERIAKVALELFDRDGYGETTIAQIAEAADVAPRTVSGYFPAKEELVFPEEEESLALLRQRLGERGADEMAPQAMRAWLRDLLEGLRGNEARLRAQSRVVAANESLRAHRQLFVARVQEMLAEAIADDVAAERSDDLEPRMAAAATTAILELINEHFEPAKDAIGDSAEIADVEAEVLEMFDRAVAFVSAGILALRDHRPA